MKKFVIFLIILSLIFLFSDSAIGKTFKVPTKKYPTIQAGIDAASDTDTVLLADGIYTGEGNKNLSWNGDDKHIVIRSKNGPENCILDGENNIGRAFDFSYTNQTINDQIIGLTIKNFVTGPPTGGGGAGIRVRGIGLTIKDCIFYNNDATYGGNAGGALDGMYTSLIVENCIFDSNKASHAGGAIIIFNTGKFVNCIFRYNIASGGGTGGLVIGGGSVINSQIIGNHSNVGGTSVGGTGGVFVSFENTVNGYYPTTFINTIIANNTNNGVTPYYKREAGGVTIMEASPKFINCTIANNQKVYNIGGIALNRHSHPLILNTIIYGNEGRQISESSWSLGGPNDCGVDIAYSNIEGGTDNIIARTGVNTFGTILDENPLFEDPLTYNYHLQEVSPCIDMGTEDLSELPDYWTGIELPETDFEGDPRTFGDSPDIGADEYVGTSAEMLDLDITNYTATKRVSLSRVKPVNIKLAVKNTGGVNGGETCPATVVGIQDSSVVYNETIDVSDQIGKGKSIFEFPDYTPDAVGDIVWTVTVDDDDPDVDVAVAGTIVNP